MSWAASQAKMQIKSANDRRTTEQAGRKKGLWGSVGGSLGGIAGLALLANPIGAVLGTSAALSAGLGAGIGSLAGGFGGAEGLTSKKNKQILAGKHKGTIFHKKDAQDLQKKLREDIVGTAVKSGVAAGFMETDALEKLATDWDVDDIVNFFQK